MSEPHETPSWKAIQQSLAELERRVRQLEQSQAAESQPTAIEPEKRPEKQPATSEELDQHVKLWPIELDAEQPTPSQRVRNFLTARAADLLPREPAASQQPSPFQQELAKFKSRIVAKFNAGDDSPNSDASNQWERFIGGQGMTWLGAAALALAVAFFIPWAWIHFQLPAWSRVLTFHLSGFAVLGLALLFRRRGLPLLARAMAGLGIFILYASAFAMEHHYHLWGEFSRLMTLLDCALITAGAIAIAVRYNSVYVIVLGALGGYIIPLLQEKGLRSVEDFQLTFYYLAFLNTALLVVASIRPWRFLKLLALAATTLMFLVWMGVAEKAVWRYETMLALHAGLFLFGTNLPALVWGKQTDEFDLATLAANSLGFVAATWLVFHQRPDQQLALVCWGMTLLHAALFAISYWRLTHADRLPRMHLAMACVFFTLAIPLQLQDSLQYLAYAWAVEGFVFTALGVYFRDDQMKASGALTLLLAALRVMLFDFFSKAELLSGTSIDRRFLVCLGVGLATMAAGSCYWWINRMARVGSSAENRGNLGFGLRVGSETGGLLLGIGNVLAMLALTRQWDGRIVLILWTLDAATLWAAALWSKQQAARTYAFLVSVTMCGGWAAYLGSETDNAVALIANSRFASLALLAALYFVAGWFERNRRLKSGSKANSLANGGVQIDNALHVLGQAALLSAATFEVYNFWNPGKTFHLLNFSSRTVEEHVAYSVVWASYAALAVAAGFVLRYRLPRLLGLGGLLAVGLKIVLIDLGSLPLILRVLALAVLGGLLLVTSYWYQKFAARLDDAP